MIGIQHRLQLTLQFSYIHLSGNQQGKRLNIFLTFFITICFSAILMYYIERGAQPEVFKNIGDGIWWAIITFATVGYGDIYPVTPLGKLLGCIICLVGVAMVAIPTGIISSSFINIIQKKEKEISK